MSGTAKVVFLLHPNNECSKAQELHLWKEAVFTAITKVLMCLEDCHASCIKWNINNGPVRAKSCSLCWGYKFIQRSGIKYHSLCDFKVLSADHLQCFKDEMNSAFNGEHVDYSAHTLAESFTAIAHDFKWEQHEIVSPIKVVKKARSKHIQNKQKQKKSFSDTSSSYILSKQNALFIVGPLPKTEQDLETYFEWTIKTQEELENILMPKHLALHFRDKHDICFFWIDTESMLPRSHSASEDVGLVMMEKFLNKNRGCVIPISMLVDHHMLLKNSAEPDDKDVNLLSNCSATSNSKCQDFTSKFVSDSFGIASKARHTCNCSSFLPISLILSYYSTKHSVVDSIKGNKKTACANLWLLKSHDTTNKFCIKVNITDILRYHANKVKCPDKCHTCITATPNPLLLSVNDDGSSGIKFLLPSNESTLPGSHAAASSENLNIFVVGKVNLSKLHAVKLLVNSSLFCEPVDPSGSFCYIMQQLRQENAGLLLRTGNSSTKSESSVSICDEFGLLQPLSINCSSISWLRDEHLQAVSNLLQSEVGKDDPQSASFHSVFQQLFQNCLDTIFSPKSANEVQDDQQSEYCKKFEPYMLESWYAAASTSPPFSEVCEEIKRNNMKQNTAVKLKKYEDLVLSELQACYKEPSLCKASGQFSGSSSNTPKETDVINGCASTGDVVEALLSQYRQSLEIFPADAWVLSDMAKKMMEITKTYVERQGVSAIADVCKMLHQKVFLRAAVIRSRNMTAERKRTECQLQILLRVEWAVFKLSAPDVCEDDYVMNEASSIIDLLRLVSVSESLTTMKSFLKDCLLSKYSSSCGKILYEVYSDLMLPIPDELQQYDADKPGDDSVFAPGSANDVPSLGPFSALSSIGSRGSTESPDLNKQIRSRPTSRIRRINSRQIIVPETAKAGDVKRSRSKTLDSVKSRLFSSTRLEDTRKHIPDQERRIVTRSSAKKANQSQNARDERDVGRVRRDLFASPSKATRNKAKSSTDHAKATPSKARQGDQQRRLRKTEVIDTPAGKQRMTALARQRLRMRRSYGSSRSLGSLADAVVEESPLKKEGQVPVKGADAKPCRRSPRHAIMLTRRHSFYRDDKSGKSRTVARAEIVQQHHEAVPPTPRPGSTGLQCDSAETSGILTPKSLLFSYSGATGAVASSKSGAPGSLRSRRRLHLTTEETPDKLTGSDDASTSQPVAELPGATSLDLLPDRGEHLDATQDAQPSALRERAGEDSSPVQPTLLKTSTFDPERQEADFREALSCTTPSKLNTCMDLPATPPTPVLLPFSSYSADSNGSRNGGSSLARLMSQAKSEPPATADHLKKTGPEVSNNDGRAESSLGDALVTPVKETGPLSCQAQIRDGDNPASVDEANKTVGPIDQFVIRTPTPAKRKCARVPTPSSVESVKKPSPNGDHIQRWPRRKRVLRNPSPVLISKRRKLSQDSCKLDAIGGFHVDGVCPLPSGDERDRVSPLSSPDVGVYVMTDENGVQKIVKASNDDTSPGIGVAQLLHLKRDAAMVCAKASRTDPRREAGSAKQKVPAQCAEQTPGSDGARTFLAKTPPAGTLLRARIGSPTSQRHVQMLLLPDDGGS